MGKNDLYNQMQAIFKEIQADATEAAEKATKKAANVTRKALKQNSPRRKGGKYAASWKTKTVKDRLSVSVIVYNAKYPGLTHLLEKGHVSRNQYGQYGRVRAYPHMDQAEEQGIEEMEKTLIDELNKQL